MNQRGEHNGNAKLKKAEVRHIRSTARLRAKGVQPNIKLLARIYHVSAQCIYKILAGSNWK